MNKKVCIIKRVLCLSLIFLLNINVFAAVVSDNDGSAFITKAEFDSLKNNFQSQIDQYNQSIDSKIDGAIASYLSGIKLDEAKKYRVYGSAYSNPPHKWDGRVCNVLYLVSIGDNGWNTTGSYNTYWFNITDNSRTNPGYGYGYWVQGYLSGSGKYFSGAENKGFIVEAYSYLPGGSSYSSADFKGFKYKVNATSGTTSSYLSWSKSGYDWRKDLCSKGLSDVFETKISIVEPQIPLYDFLDEGDATIYFAKCKNGYAEEGGAQGGADGIPHWMDNPASSYSSTAKCILTLEHAGGTSDKLDVIAMPNKTWTSVPLHVSAGDRLFLNCHGYSSANSGYYCIFWFSSDIAGWEREIS